MRIVFTIWTVVLSISVLQSQHVFQNISPADVPAHVLQKDRGVIPEHFASFQIDHKALLSQLKGDVEGTQSLFFPIDEKTTMQFEMQEASNMHPDLQKKYTNTRAFRGSSVDGKYNLVLSYSPFDVHATLRTPSGTKYFLPYAERVNDYGILVNRVDYFPASGIPIICGNDEYLLEQDDQSHLQGFTLNPGSQIKSGDPLTLRSYRIAVACTAEFTAMKMGVAGAMAAINTSLTIINDIYHREIGMEFQLISNNEDVIFENTATDPYFSVTDGGGLLIQNQAALDDFIGTENYDVGHVFTIGCSMNLGGIAAFGSVCNEILKGRGVTCHSSQNVAVITSEIMSHEIGHSFGCSHSWNNCPQFQDQRASDTAVEPGSGSTIMSYAGACGATNNVQNGSDAYFHGVNIEQMYNFREIGGGSTCGLNSGSNQSPDVTITSPGDVVIPIGTPFKLTAEATDPEGHGLSYCWEQIDLGPPADLITPVLNSPLFRSYEPVSTPTRMFPRLSNVLAGTVSNVERLPTYSRELNFRVTMRDDFLPIGTVAWADIAFEADESAGPFRVTQPVAVSDWQVGSAQTITWDVANTNASPVNCEFVNILLSTDGGQNFSPIATNAPNNGSIEVVIPDSPTSTGRIMVESVGNVFFNVNQGDFTISPASGDGLFFGFENNNANGTICLPGETSLNLTSEAIGSFTNMVTLSAPGLPAGASVEFSENPVAPGTAVTMTVSFDGSVPSGMNDLTVDAAADGITTISRNFSINAIDQDFSALAVSSPTNGQGGVAENTSISWAGLSNADSYDIRVSSDPTFASIDEEGSDIGSTSFTPSQSFEKNTLYFVQVRAKNECLTGEWSDISVFHTVNFACSQYTQNDAQVITVNATDLESELTIAQAGEISDLNIKVVDIDYQPVGSFILTLQAPTGEEEIFYNKKCGGDSKIQIGFDNEATEAIPCPPSNGGIYLPDGGDFSNFNGLESQGNWKLKIENTIAGFNNGMLNNWEIEICANATPSNPFIDINEGLEVKTDDEQWISTLLLSAKDDDTGPDDLTFTIIQEPQFGTITRVGGSQLGLGETFTQTELNTYQIKYVDGPGAEAMDEFTFIVTDGTGGFSTPETFQIAIDDSFDPFSSVEVLPVDAFTIFPNPAKSAIYLEGPASVELRTVSLIDSKGQLLSLDRWENSEQLQIDINVLPAGIYYLQIKEGNAIGTKKFTKIQ